MTPQQPGEIQIEDQLERRIRKPVDLLRCVLSCIEIVALALAGIAARATTGAVQADIVGASRQIPLSLLTLARSLAFIALFILPVTLQELDAADAHVPERFKALHFSQLPGGKVTAEFAQRLAEFMQPRSP